MCVVAAAWCLLEDLRPVLLCACGLDQQVHVLWHVHVALVGGSERSDPVPRWSVLFCALFCCRNSMQLRKLV